MKIVVFDSGLGSLSVIKAIEANVDIVDTCLSPLSLRTSQPPIEPLLITLKNSERDPNLNLDEFIRASEKLKSILGLKIGECQDKGIGDVQYRLPMMKTII